MVAACVPAVTSMAEQVHQRACNQQYEWQPAQTRDQMGTVLRNQKERGDDQKQVEARPDGPGSGRTRSGG